MRTVFINLSEPVLVVNSFISAFIMLTIPTLPVSSHVARNMVSFILTTVRWIFKNEVWQKLTAWRYHDASTLVGIFCLQNHGLSRLPFRAKYLNRNIHHSQDLGDQCLPDCAREQFLIRLRTNISEWTSSRNGRSLSLVIQIALTVTVSEWCNDDEGHDISTWHALIDTDCCKSCIAIWRYRVVTNAFSWHTKWKKREPLWRSRSKIFYVQSAVWEPPVGTLKFRS